MGGTDQIKVQFSQFPNGSLQDFPVPCENPGQKRDFTAFSGDDQIPAKENVLPKNRNVSGSMTGGMDDPDGVVNGLIIIVQTVNNWHFPGHENLGKSLDSWPALFPVDIWQVLFMRPDGGAALFPQVLGVSDMVNIVMREENIGNPVFFETDVAALGKHFIGQTRAAGINHDRPFGKSDQIGVAVGCTFNPKQVFTYLFHAFTDPVLGKFLLNSVFGEKFFGLFQ